MRQDKVHVQMCKQIYNIGKQIFSLTVFQKFSFNFYQSAIEVFDEFYCKVLLK